MVFRKFTNRNKLDELLNLAMSESRILQLSEYGAAAGREFVARFGAPGHATSMNWENHQLIRLRLK
ncbi:hypothetical protein TU81_03905 [Pseudomonas lini]|nr:hypothetical protein TU81_03905 [Pseudomonas lini]KNH44817.1 hypothetical protein ACS73_19020 [Pseudomonas lini]